MFFSKPYLTACMVGYVSLWHNAPYKTTPCFIQPEVLTLFTKPENMQVKCCQDKKL
ncbi:MAG: hypothetical protein KME28_05585 [Pelatocladus maniniholoensis HA4357-MV3]|uniref:Uncharacterized protein n=1 Tax=Pelatocladus maniniholoensis HA4357-MV3 TaxID=1117104 RepID=A0A9E3H5J5_9NOST|nr:hypothetical protein [Pelatocladus maniniholoensis HA4357-MV3]